MPRPQNHLHLRVLATLHHHQMLRPGDIAGIAVSGGADSVALLRLLSDLQSKLGIRITIVHFNHQLRGSESDGDELFVRDLARQMSLDFIAGTEDVAAWAREHACNLEDAARKCRYSFFAKLIREGSVTRICVGHTADDQAETVLAKIVRGTGPVGLGGIFPVAEFITRPLIEIRRAELREYLQSEGHTWREDSTNLDETRLRARIRARLLPQLEQDFQPVIVSHLNKLSELAREDDEFWSAVVEERFAALVQKQESVLSLPIDDLLRPMKLTVTSGGNHFPMMALSTRLIRRTLQEIKGDRSGFNSRHIEDILHLAIVCASGHQIHLPGGIVVERSFNNLLFSRTILNSGQNPRGKAVERVEFQYALSLASLDDQTDGEDVVLPEIRTRIRLKVIDWPVMQRDTRHDAIIANWKLLRAPTVVRSWLPGDAFRPQGRKRSRKLKHLMREKRIAPRDRPGWPVLTSAGEIVWVRGFPVAQEFGADKDTRKVLAISEEPL